MAILASALQTLLSDQKSFHNNWTRDWGLRSTADITRDRELKKVGNVYFWEVVKGIKIGDFRMLSRSNPHVPSRPFFSLLVPSSSTLAIFSPPAFPHTEV
ncbi:MAG: hypothetical protein Q9210_006417 [Variospora velana]